MNWQDEYQVSINAGLRWRIDYLCLELYRQKKEWLVCWDNDVTEPHGEPLVETLAEGCNPSGDCKHERYVVKSTTSRVKLGTRTADRSVVARPRDPFILPSDEQATLFVTTPLWLEVYIDSPPRLLKGFPVRRLSDTWFGPSLLAGDLCYDSRTRAVLELEQVEYRPSRIITPLVIHNQAETPLTLERVQLPVPLLSIYRAENGRLWTEQLTLTREEDGEMAALKIGSSAPSQAVKAHKVAEPREASPKNTLIRAFGGLFN